MMKLVVIDKAATRPVLQEVNLILGAKDAIFTVGRHSHSDIVIDHHSVSRHHLELMSWQNGLLVRDLGSTNGSRFKAERLLPYQGTVMRPGEQLQIGGIILRLEATEARIETYPQAASSSTSSGYAPVQSAVVTPAPALGGNPANFGPVVTARPAISQSQIWFFWAYLLLIGLAELLTALAVQFGLLLHAGLLVALTLQGATGRALVTRRLALALTLAPLIRLLSLSMPLINFPQLFWYPLVAIPLLLTAWIISRQLGLGRQNLGLTAGQLLPQLLLTGGGLGLGTLEYFILRPAPLLTNNEGWLLYVLAGLGLLIFTGFNEEVIFRGLLQTVATPVLKKGGALFYVALLFAILHLGYLSALDLLLVFGVGLLFGYLVRWGGSILGVTLAHGLTNITLFLIMPSLHQNPNSNLAIAMPWLVAGGTLLSLLGAGLLIWAARRKTQLDIGSKPNNIVTQNSQYAH